MKSPNIARMAILRGLAAAFILLGALAPAAAQSSESATAGRFRAIIDDAIVLESGARHPIKPGRARAITKALALITAGQGVELELDGDQAVAIRATEPSFELDATFDGMIESPGALFIRIRQGGPYQVPADKISQVNNQTLVIERGAYVRLTMFRKSVIAVQARIGAMPPALLPLPSELKESLTACKAKHIISYNDQDRRFLVLSANPQALTLQPVDDKGKPAGKRVWLPKGFIRSFTNHSSKPKPRVPGEAGVPETGEDRIAKLKLAVGDTVGLGLRRGVIANLDPEAIFIRIWEKNRFTSTRRYERADVADKIQRRELRAAFSVSARGGELTILTYRQRIVHERRIDFRARLSHDLKGYVLAGAELVGTIDGDLERPAAIERVALPPILAGEIHDYETQIKLVKPSIQLRVNVDPDLNFISLDTKEARRFIAQRLLETDPARLLSAYDAVVANKDPDLIRVLATRALDDSLGEQTRADVVNVLRRCGKASADALLELATNEGDGLRLYNLDPRGAILKKPPRISETVYRGLLVDLIAKLGPAIGPEHALGLFTLYERYGDADLSARILEAIRTHSDAAVTALIEIASEVGSQSSKEENARIDRAAEVIRGLKDAALKPLSRKLRRLGLVADAEKIRSGRAAGTANAVLINKAIDAIVAERRKQHLQKLRLRLTSIRDDLDAIGETKAEPEVLVKRLNSYLYELKQDIPLSLKDRSRILALDIKCELGVALRKLKRRGEAAEAFAAAADNSADTGKNYKRKARRLLAEIIVEALREELDAAVLRSGPGHRFARIRPLIVGEKLSLDQRIKPTVSWAPITNRSSGKTAWVQISLTDYAPNAEQITVLDSARPIKELREVIDEARTYNAQAAAGAIDAEIKLLTRETYDFVRSARHHDVLKNLERLEQLAPGNQTREELYWKSWAAVNWIFIALGGSILLSLLVFGLRLLFNRKTQKIAAPEEYIYYGPDRARRERELE